MTRLKDKVAVITGGNTGIGEAIAKRYVQEGAKVVVSGRSLQSTERVQRLMKELGKVALYVQADVSVEEDVKNLITKTVEHFGRLDIAVNNAGVMADPKPLIDQTLESYDFVMGVNLRGVFLSMKHEITAMLKTGSGVIINTTSVGGVIGNYNISPYIASKHGVIGLTKAGALEYAKHGIRINAVAPGGVESEMLKHWLPGEALAGMASNHPIGRNSQPEEQAGLFAFLASDDASFITGSTYFNDGGYTAK